MKFSSSFIFASPEINELEKFVAAPYFRKVVCFDRLPEKAEITLTGLGFYRLWINGTEITKGILAPYISNPNHFVYYDNYDILEYLNDGENVFGFMLGNGMQNAPGGAIWNFHKADFRGAPRFAFCIEYESDGKTFSAEADESVRWSRSPLYFDDLRCGERYDAGKEQDGWNKAGFDDSDWNEAVFCEAPKGEKRLCEAESVKPTGEILKPVSIRRGELDNFVPNKAVAKIVPQELPGERMGYIYDFGANRTGVCRLKIKGKAGQRIELQFAEHLSDEGKVFYANIDFYPDGYAQRDVYICKGGEEEIFEPAFTYHGFRYCLVIGLDDEQATEDLLSFVIINSDVKECGNFICSDETANALQKMCRNSDLSNFHYFPTDCPHREKNGWTGDIATSAEHILMNITAEKSFVEWMRNVCRSQAENGWIPPVIPNGEWGGDCGPAWNCVLTFVPYYVYRFRGNRKLMEDTAEAICNHLVYSRNMLNEKGLIDFGIGDWCCVRNQVKATREYVTSVYLCALCDKAGFIFDELGMAERKEYAVKLCSDVKEAVRKNYVDIENMRVDTNCQTSLAIAIFFDILTEEEKPAFANLLIDLIHRNDDFIDFGLIGARTLFHVLSDFGESELAYKMITRPEWPSFGNFIERGFTSMPEDFQMEGKRIDSLNHHFMCDISNWFISRVAGLRYNPGGRNFKELIFEPAFIEKLNFAESFYDSIFGKITVRWNRNGDEITAEASFPKGMELTFKAPKGFEIVSSDVSETSAVYILK